LASREACRNKGFVLDGRLLGLQFHLETTAESAAETLSDESRFLKINGIMYSLLDKLKVQNAFIR